uniref:Uncharacterized protein n=1 Tax=Amblyomma parvum TaxID=251391 RepID=A0A023G2Q7_AMBPA
MLNLSYAASVGASLLLCILYISHFALLSAKRYKLIFPLGLQCLLRVLVFPCQQKIKSATGFWSLGSVGIPRLGFIEVFPVVLILRNTLSCSKRAKGKKHTTLYVDTVGYISSQYSVLKHLALLKALSWQCYFFCIDHRDLPFSQCR